MLAELFGVVQSSLQERAALLKLDWAIFEDGVLVEVLMETSSQGTPAS